MSDKNHLCSKCDRELLNMEHRKCMYCGEPVPEHLQLSESEASAVREKNYESWRAEQARDGAWGTSPENPKHSASEALKNHLPTISGKPTR